MKEFIKWLFDEKIKYFAGGSIAGIAPGIVFLLDIPAFPKPLLIWVFVLKFLGAIIIAFGSGVATALASDLYKSVKNSKFIARLRNKLFNRKKLDNGKDQEKRA